MAAAEPKGDAKDAGATGEPGATSSEEQPQESLEDLLRTLNRHIKTTGWLQENTAEKWMADNPETAKEVQRVIAEKKASEVTEQKKASEVAEQKKASEVAEQKKASEVDEQKKDGNSEGAS